ncbi:MAG: hypothetical protein KBT48_09840 [Firmicutes bacterium]|nr:hypothetical protein [Bacillota bacterium]
MERVEMNITEIIEMLDCVPERFKDLAKENLDVVHEEFDSLYKVVLDGFWNDGEKNVFKLYEDGPVSGFQIVQLLIASMFYALTDCVVSDTYIFGQIDGEEPYYVCDIENCFIEEAELVHVGEKMNEVESDYACANWDLLTYYFNIKKSVHKVDDPFRLN